MAALRVAVDLTALDEPALGLEQPPMPVRFVEALIRQAPDVRFVLLTSPGLDAELARLDAPNARRVATARAQPSSSALARFGARVGRRVQRTRLAAKLGGLRRWHLLVSRVVRPGVLARLAADVVFCPFVTSAIDDRSVPLVAAVHDLQHVSHPHLLSAAERAKRAQAFNADSRRATWVVCSSASVRAAALDSGVAEARLRCIPPGRLLAHTSVDQATVAATLTGHGLTRGTYLLAVADFEPRHNHRLLLTALAAFRHQYPQSPTRLVCVGGPASDAARWRATAEQMGLGTSVIFPGRLDCAELSALVLGCRAVVVATLYESVGEMALEALRLGRPLLCSRIPDLIQLTGEAALTFDPHQPAELAAAFERIEQEPTLANRLAQLGPRRVAALDGPQIVAEAYLSLLDKARITCPQSR